MKIFQAKVSIYLYKIIAVLLLLAVLYFGYEYLIGEDNTKATLLYGGLATGLFVALIQFLFSWNEHKEIEIIKSLGIKRILLHRDDEVFYRDLVKSANKKINVMGVTGLRFMQDFADEGRGRPEKKVLIDALHRGVEVKMLLPKKEYLIKDHEQEKFTDAEVFFKKVKRAHHNFDYKYFKHIPAHSIVVVDDECLLGPVFPQIESRDTPCLHLLCESAFAIRYLSYFEQEWKDAERPT